MKLAIPVIDAHVHLLDPEHITYDWLKKVPAIDRSCSPEDYAEATADYSVGQYIAIEAAAQTSDKQHEFTWLEKCAREDPRFAGIVAYANVAQGKAVKNELDLLAKSPMFKGIRFTLGKAYQENPHLCTEAKFIEGVQALQTYAVPFDLAFDPEQFDDVYAFARACPEVQLIINHTGKPAFATGFMEPWLSYMQKLATLPNVACKVSDILRDSHGETKTTLFRPFIYELVNMFGMDRLLYGSDFPVVTLYGTYGSQLKILQELFSNFSTSEQTAFFSGNARRLYHLDRN